MKKLAILIMMVWSFSTIAETSAWWSAPYPSSFDTSRLKPQQHITVQGAAFVDEKGDTFEFKGVSIADPDKLRQQGKWPKETLFFWQQQWGSVAKTAPVIATELGGSHESAPGAHVPTINNDGTYGPRIIDFMSERGISWIAWVFDPEWAPQMISNWDYEPTKQGVFFKEVLQGEYRHNSN